MGNLVFQATLGGQVSLVGPNTASTFTLNVPAVSSTLATLTGTETFTNKTFTTPTINQFSSAAATNLTIQSAGTTAITIDTLQNVLVGTTSNGQPDANFAQLRNIGGPSGVNCLSAGHITGTASGIQYAYFVYGGLGIGSITQNGTTGVLYNLTSDYRLKSNQEDLTGAKDFIMALKPKKWQWWDGSGEGVGFIAHEFMEVAKYSGHGEKDAVDEEGNPVYQSIQPSSSEVMANLVSLIQEQQALITQLQADVAALKA
jgi:hypothetical protein